MVKLTFNWRIINIQSPMQKISLRHFFTTTKKSVKRNFDPRSSKFEFINRVKIFNNWMLFSKVLLRNLMKLKLHAREYSKVK